MYKEKLNNALNKQILSEDELRLIDAYWRASNYLAACQLYLRDNPLLKEPLKAEHIKKKIVATGAPFPGRILFIPI